MYLELKPRVSKFITQTYGQLQKFFVGLQSEVCDQSAVCFRICHIPLYCFLRSTIKSMKANIQSFFQQPLLAGYTQFNISLRLNANTYVLSICKKNCSWISSLKKHALIFLRLKSIALQISTKFGGYKKNITILFLTKRL